MKLNLGCQVHYFDGWTNQDIVGDDPNIKVDLVCDAAKLPLEDNSVDFIYAGHLVEHYYPDTLPAAIKEWYRVLKPGGKLAVLTPDTGAVCRDYVAGKFPIEALQQPIYGRYFSYDSAPERHHISFDEKLLEAFMQGGHFTNPGDPVPEGIQWSAGERFDLQRPPAELEPFMDTHISRGAYQIGFVATK